MTSGTLCHDGNYFLLKELNRINNDFTSSAFALTDSEVDYISSDFSDGRARGNPLNCVNILGPLEYIRKIMELRRAFKKVCVHFIWINTIIILY